MRSAPLLSHPFKPAGGFALFGRLTLFADRIERTAFGRVQETIPLTDVVDVHWQTAANDAPNFTLTLRGGRQLSGHLQGAGLWKVKLASLLKRPRTARQAAGRAARSAA